MASGVRLTQTLEDKLALYLELRESRPQTFEVPGYPLLLILF